MSKSLLDYLGVDARLGQERSARVPEIVEPDLREPICPRPYPYLACYDMALSQGGLTTGMELIALRRPFVSFPLHNHFDQRVHVANRFRRYGHTVQMDYREITLDGLAEVVGRRLATPPGYKPVEGGAAHRAAELVARALG